MYVKTRLKDQNVCKVGQKIINVCKDETQVKCENSSYRNAHYGKNDHGKDCFEVRFLYCA